MATLKHHRRGSRRALVGRTAGVLAVAAGVALGALSTAGAASKSLVISAVKTSSAGTVLSSRTTLYTLKPSGTACTAKCLKIWPAVLLPKGVTKATAGSGVDAAKLGTIARAGGLLQVTYGGKPLYRFYMDTAPGQVNGDVTDTWGKWSAVVTVKPSTGGTPTTSTTTTTSPGGGGVGF